MSRKGFFGQLSKISTISDRRVRIPKEAAEYLGIDEREKSKVMVYMSKIAGEKVLILRKVGK